MTPNKEFLIITSSGNICDEVKPDVDWSARLASLGFSQEITEIIAHPLNGNLAARLAVIVEHECNPEHKEGHSFVVFLTLTEDGLNYWNYGNYGLPAALGGLDDSTSVQEPVQPPDAVGKVIQCIPGVICLDPLHLRVFRCPGACLVEAGNRLRECPQFRRVGSAFCQAFQEHVVDALGHEPSALMPSLEAQQVELLQVLTFTSPDTATMAHSSLNIM